EDTPTFPSCQSTTFGYNPTQGPGLYAAYAIELARGEYACPSKCLDDLLRERQKLEFTQNVFGLLPSGLSRDL
ncbi:MAG: hypothetical protein ACE5JF_13410, partial [Anaerolineales bacterium]